MKLGKEKLINLSFVIILVFGLAFLTKVVLKNFFADANSIEAEGQHAVFKNITSKAGNNLILENSNNPDFVILDVRTPGEFAGGRLEKALNIDFYSQTFQNKLDNLNKDKIYLIYCKSGHRSGQTVDIMKRRGFKKVYNLIGGIDQWNRQGYQIVR